MDAPRNETESRDQFAQQGQEQRSSMLGDLLYLLKNNRKWWMLPLMIVFIGFGIFMVLSATGVAPFIYTVF